MYPGKPCGVTGGGDSNSSKLLLADREEGRTGGADTCELEMTFGICMGKDYLGLAGQCHTGSCHRDTSHTMDFSVDNVDVTHTATAVLTRTTLGACEQTFGCREINVINVFRGIKTVIS